MNVVITEEMRVLRSLGGFDPDVGDAVLCELRPHIGRLCLVTGRPRDGYIAYQLKEVNNDDMNDLFYTEPENCFSYELKITDEMRAAKALGWEPEEGEEVIVHLPRTTTAIDSNEVFQAGLHVFSVSDCEVQGSKLTVITEMTDSTLYPLVENVWPVI